MIDNGADTLFVYANQVGLGVIESAKTKGAKVVGYQGDSIEKTLPELDLLGQRFL